MIVMTYAVSELRRTTELSKENIYRWKIFNLYHRFGNKSGNVQIQPTKDHGLV
eukprot:TRINITY_DN7473_c0_g1_i1.p3 TRINITY_DN7473_c0_g1~~TRINITY_DN7473_c0_g1_i1.p3  ORF type:complete len:53 (-),score=2.85 TRINITY_DN7473_c0_g1_i1:201-359(-)